DRSTEWAALLRAVTGWDVDAAELHATARRIVLAKRVFNLREGATAADDTLPARLLEDETSLGNEPGGPSTQTGWPGLSRLMPRVKSPALRIVNSTRPGRCGEEA